MTARYEYLRCPCPCQAWLVRDRQSTKVVAEAASAWDAAQAVDHLNRGLPVHVTDEPPVRVAALRRYARLAGSGVVGAFIGWAGYVGLVLVFGGAG